MIHYDSLSQNATDIITKYDSYFITKYDSFLTKCYSYYKVRLFYYKMQELFQNATFITNCDSKIYKGDYLSEISLEPDVATDEGPGQNEM